MPTAHAPEPDPLQQEQDPLPALNNNGHVGHCSRCLGGLPASLVELDTSRMAVAFYCLGTLDLTGLAPRRISETDRASWRAWIWEQYADGGFRPGPSVGRDADPAQPGAAPHLIMTYCALLSLAVLRDDFGALDRAAVARTVGACQDDEGGFATAPGAGDADLRMSYCAFVVCALLCDWSAVDVPRALAYVRRCRTYEGGYGQTPRGEAIGGPTYCALACLRLAPGSAGALSAAQRAATVRWLLGLQSGGGGGFAGRTGKVPDACYGFWCGAALAIVEGDFLMDRRALGMFLAQCQYKFGGIAKAPGEHPDPYHTYLAIAAAAIAAPDPAWSLQPLDPLINATHETSQWAREHVPAPGR
ncbi:terpenoid cyclases/protein prenyltransferase alpha-alpha toroid [Gloeopeniophorella convolvens]|nr:terpenoid cyclases/protein prenyltransferase alpha-alpha toroid [Gloeopeniophorella convolvens]